ncbi:hypothetical protein O0L34_g8075 [Tuta absoluta]|nr:hypothetical protein O0L34_g8075 [Tuta absoluta]
MKSYIEYLVDLYFVNKFGVKSCVDYYKRYKTFDDMIPMCYGAETCRSAVRSWRAAAGLLVFICAVDYGTWLAYSGWLAPSFFIIDYFYGFIKILTIIDVTCQITFIEFRVRLLADTIDDFDANQNHDTSSYVNMCNDIHDDKLQIKYRNKRLLAMKARNHVNDCEVVFSIARCYILLLDQTEYINNMFGIRMLFACANILVDMTILLNVTIRIAMQSFEERQVTGYFIPVNLYLRFAYKIFVFLTLMRKCENTYSYKDRIIASIDRLLLNKCTLGAGTRGALRELRLLVSSRALSFHAGKFFTLHYSVLVSIASAVVTYTTILLLSF